MYLELRRQPGLVERQSTFGQLWLINDVDETFLGWTVEREWDNNKTGTALPVGSYTLVPHDGAKYQNTFALVNLDLDVGHWPGEAKRNVCVIHSANHGSELLGCIAVGNNIQVINGKMGVGDSAVTTAGVVSLIRDRKIANLIITVQRI